MATETINPKEVILNGVRYPLINKIKPMLTSVFPEKQVVGDFTKVSDPYVDNWVIADQRGGILVEEMDEKKHADRCYWSTCDTRWKGHLILNPLATEILSVHKVQDTSNTATEVDATNTATLYALLNEIKADYNTHIASTTYHKVADILNAVTADDATTEGTAVALANEIKSDYNSHIGNRTVHIERDTVNTVTTADATDEATAITLANETKADYNAHLLVGVATVNDGGRTIALRPDGAGAVTQLTPSAGTNWSCVDEVYAGDTDYVEVDNDSSGLYDLYNCKDIIGGSSDTINSITVYVRARYTGAGASSGTAAPVFRSNSTVTTGTYQAVTSSWAIYSQTWTTNPADSGAFEWSDINTLQIGAGLKSDSGAGYKCQASQVWVSVNFTGTFPRTIFCNFNGGLYIARGTKLQKLDSGGDGFDDVKTDFGSNITDLIAGVHNKLYVFLDDGGCYWYIDGADSATETDVTAGTYGVWWDDKLYAINASGAIGYSTTPDVASPTWTAGGQLDMLDTWATNSLGTFYNIDGDDVIYAGTKDGLWVYDNANSKWLKTQLQTPKHDNSCKGMTAWRDAYYVSSGLDVLSYIPDVPAQIRSVGLAKDDGLPIEYLGEIIKLVPGYNEMFALVDSTQSSGTSTSAVFAYDGYGWQCWWIGNATEKAMYSGLVSSAYAHRLWFDHNDLVYYIPLHRALHNPLKLSTDTHAPAGVHITPWFDADWQTGNKLALRFKVDVLGDVSADEDVIVRYRTDHATSAIASTNFTTLGTIETSGLTTYNFASSVGVAFKSIQFRFDLARQGTDTDETPDIQYAVLEYVKVIPKRWGWRFTVDCSQDWHNKNSKQLIDALITAAELETLVTLVYDTTTKYVQIKSVTGERETGRTRKGQYEVFCTELF